MGRLDGLIKTVAVSRNPHVALATRFSKKRRLITFVNGSKFWLTWGQFRILRDNYAVMKKYEIQQLEADSFKIKFETFEFTSPLLTLCIVAQLTQKYTVERLADDLFKIKSDRSELEGNLDMLCCVWELEHGEYDRDCRGKTVLDIGGFQGESAVYFTMKGAKKVVIYEPVAEHHKFIRKNMTLNGIDAEIHEAGIGARDEVQTVGYDKTDAGFGFCASGHHEMQIKIRNIAEVIKESGAAIAKIDCEGAEACLVEVPAEILRQIEVYMIEVHAPKIKKELVRKFKDSGFTLTKSIDKNEQMSVIFLKRDGYKVHQNS
jgi:FkbM family methyltransferase